MQRAPIVRRGHGKKHAGSPIAMEGLERRSLMAADLVFSELDLDRSRLVTAREEFAYQFTVENRGDKRSAATTTTSVLSRDKVWGNADDVPIVGSVRVRALRPGEAASWNVTIKPLPSWVPPGRYFVGRTIDPDHRVVERNERNNVRWSRSFIIVPEKRDWPKLSVRALDESGPGPILINGDPSPSAAEGTRFDAAELDGYESRTFEISNTGPVPLYIFGVDIRLTAPFDSGSDAPDDGWFIVHAPASRVAPGATTRFEIGFLPKDSNQEYRGRITISSSDVARRSFAFSVAGRSGSPELEATIAGEPASEDFTEAVFVGSFEGVDPIDIPVIVTNTGTGVLRLAPPTLPELFGQTPFVLVGAPTEPISLLAGESRTFVVRFTAVTPGFYSTTLTFTSGFELSSSWSQFSVDIELELNADRRD